MFDEQCEKCDAKIFAFTKEYVWYKCGRVLTQEFKEVKNEFGTVETTNLVFTCDHKKDKSHGRSDSGRGPMRTFREWLANENARRQNC